jgi:hypothetical protein
MTIVLSISDATIWSIPYDRKTFIVQATGERYLCLIVVIKRLRKMPSNEPMELRTLDTYDGK